MRTLFTTTGTLTPADAKSVRSFSFDVPAGTEALSLVFEWDPMHSDDADKNRVVIEAALASWGRLEMRDHPDVKRNIARQLTLLNTVLVEPSGRWRGRSDRGKGTRNAPLLVDPDAPAPGFVRGPLPAGRWSVDVEVHSVATERCTFFLEVCAATPAAASPFARARVRNARAHTPATPRFVRGELHSHTRHSDGSHTVSELVRRAGELGLDFLALTDHNTTSGGPELSATGFPTILGAELTTFRGHHVVLGLDEMVPWHKAGRVLDPSDVAAGLRAQGALFTLTHPFNLGDPICTGCRWMTPDLDPRHIDLVEIWHRRWIGDTADNPRAYALWNELWRKGHRPTAVAVRDWHNKNHEAPLPGPLPTTAVHAASLAAADILAGLKRGAVYLTRGPALEFALEHGGHRTPLGAHGSAAKGRVTARVGLRGVDEPARAELYKRGERVSVVDVAAGQSEIALVDDTGGAGWYRVELRTADGPLAITNHVELSA